MVTDRSSEVKPGHCLFICEIGPIRDFTRSSRKTIDFWGASFLFSYIMAEIANKVKAAGAEIFLPDLKDNPMITGTEPVRWGSVPDQLYFLVNIAKKNEIRGILSSALADIMKVLTAKVAATIPQKPNQPNDSDEISRYFNFFYVVHEIKDSKPTSTEYEAAEKKCRVRAAMRPFDQLTNETSISKWDKCDLCGDRKKAHEIPSLKKSNNKYDTERICSVCLLKRSLKEIVKKVVPRAEPPAYESTSDIAAIPVEKHYEDLCNNDGLKPELKENLKTAYENLMQDSEPEAKKDKDDGRRYFDRSLISQKSFAAAIQDCDRELQNSKFPWLDRPFYAIAYLDGDNVGDVLKNNAGLFPDILMEISQSFAYFSRWVVHDIVNYYGGKIIYCAGDDTTLIIHPAFLLDCIIEMNKAYQFLFRSNRIPSPLIDDLTLSAGALVCYHKYPLSEAISKAGVLLKEKAKSKPGKNATAIALIQGHAETLQLTLANKRLEYVTAIRELFLTSDLSRTTPYRLRESEDFLEIMRRNGFSVLRKNYLQTLIDGARDQHLSGERINELVEILSKFDDEDAMVSALLLARFLAGDK